MQAKAKRSARAPSTRQGHSRTSMNDSNEWDHANTMYDMPMDASNNQRPDQEYEQKETFELKPDS